MNIRSLAKTGLAAMVLAGALAACSSMDDSATTGTGSNTSATAPATSGTNSTTSGSMGDTGSNATSPQ